MNELDFSKIQHKFFKEKNKLLEMEKALQK